MLHLSTIDTKTLELLRYLMDAEEFLKIRLVDGLAFSCYTLAIENQLILICLVKSMRTTILISTKPSIT